VVNFSVVVLVVVIKVVAFFDVHTEQSTPLQFSGHLHVKSASIAIQVPPFLHGFNAHGVSLFGINNFLKKYITT
jgi:hypothetical protein